MYVHEVSMPQTLRQSRYFSASMMKSLCVIIVALSVNLVLLSRNALSYAVTTYKQEVKPYYEIIDSIRWCGAEVICTRDGGNKASSGHFIAGTLVELNQLAPNIRIADRAGRWLMLGGDSVTFMPVDCIRDFTSTACNAISPYPAPPGYRWATYISTRAFPQEVSGSLAFVIQADISVSGFFVSDDGDQLFGDTVRPLVLRLGNTPNAISYQGVIAEAGGTPIANGTHTLDLRLYEEPIGGTAVSSEVRSVDIQGGVFNTMIGTDVPGFPLFDRQYYLGVAVDGSAELMPRTILTASPYALHAQTAEQAQSVMPGAWGVVSSINGAAGEVVIRGNGGTLVNRSGNLITIGGGGLTLPYIVSIASATTAFSVTNTLSGTTGEFVNMGLGSALTATATTQNSAVLRLQNRSSNPSAQLISGVDSAGSTTFEVAANGRTTINAPVGDALRVTTSAVGEAALSLSGGLLLNGPVGTGSLDLAAGQVVITNAYAKANSIIMITITTATGVTTPVPIRVSSQGNRTFTVAAIAGNVGVLSGSYSFNYLIINR